MNYPLTSLPIFYLCSLCFDASKLTIKTSTISHCQDMWRVLFLLSVSHLPLTTLLSQIDRLFIFNLKYRSERCISNHRPGPPYARLSLPLKHNLRHLKASPPLPFCPGRSESHVELRSVHTQLLHLLWQATLCCRSSPFYSMEKKSIQGNLLCFKGISWCGLYL